MLEIALIIFGITAVIGIALGLYLTHVCTRVSDDEEYESNNYASKFNDTPLGKMIKEQESENYANNYRGFYQGDDKEILEKLNKDFRR